MCTHTCPNLELCDPKVVTPGPPDRVSFSAYPPVDFNITYSPDSLKKTSSSNWWWVWMIIIVVVLISAFILIMLYKKGVFSKVKSPTV
jgi:hypothetical protein